MIGLTLIAIPIAFIYALFLIGKSTRSWGIRIVGWFLISAPWAVWLWDYPVIALNHETVCQQSGGLRIIVPLEKSYSVALFNGESNFYGAEDAEGILRRFHPQIQSVETIGERGSQKGKRFSYTVDVKSVAGDSKNYRYVKTPLLTGETESYIVSVSTINISNGKNKTQTTIRKSGKVFATWTSYSATWNPGGLLQHTWSCFTINQTHKNDYDHLVSLILK